MERSFDMACGLLSTMSRDELWRANDLSYLNDLESVRLVVIESTKDIYVYWEQIVMPSFGRENLWKGGIDQ